MPDFRPFNIYKFASLVVKTVEYDLCLFNTSRQTKLPRQCYQDKEINIYIMIKRFFICLAAAVGITFAVSARDTYAHDASVLPRAAQTTLANNFKSRVSVVKIDKDFGRVSDYEVILTDGTEISFDRNGNWDNVEVASSGAVPSAFVPSPIADYVRTNMAGARIVGIDKERSGYDVELSNGVEIKFDKDGRFLRYDD